MGTSPLLRESRRQTVSLIHQIGISQVDATILKPAGGWGQFQRGQGTEEEGD